MNLNDLVEVIPPRLAHAVTRLLGLSTVYAVFCPRGCCEDPFEIWAEEADGPVST